jgi:hypothetical protein
LLGVLPSLCNPDIVQEVTTSHWEPDSQDWVAFANNNSAVTDDPLPAGTHTGKVRAILANPLDLTRYIPTSLMVTTSQLWQDNDAQDTSCYLRSVKLLGLDDHGEEVESPDHVRRGRSFAHGTPQVFDRQFAFDSWDDFLNDVEKVIGVQFQVNAIGAVGGEPVRCGFMGPVQVRLHLANVSIGDEEPVKLIDRTTAVWRYRWQHSTPGDNWAHPTFDDSKWKTGSGLFGFGDGDDDDDQPEDTFLDPHQSPTPLTAYFRTTFQVHKDAECMRLLRVSARIDDGAVIYLNGMPLWWYNMFPVPAPRYTDLAETTVVDEEKHKHAYIPESVLLLGGENTLAVEVHQASADSSDLHFSMSLAAYDICNTTRHGGDEPSGPAPIFPPFCELGQERCYCNADGSCNVAALHCVEDLCIRVTGHDGPDKPATGFDPTDPIAHVRPLDCPSCNEVCGGSSNWEECPTDCDVEVICTAGPQAPGTGGDDGDSKSHSGGGTAADRNTSSDKAPESGGGVAVFILLCLCGVFGSVIYYLRKKHMIRRRVGDYSTSIGELTSGVVGFVHEEPRYGGRPPTAMEADTADDIEVTLFSTQPELQRPTKQRNPFFDEDEDEELRRA